MNIDSIMFRAIFEIHYGTAQTFHQGLPLTVMVKQNVEYIETSNCAIKVTEMMPLF